ncbi:MAG TPA: hypothetical protein VIM01_16560 [Dermatophilaceae bacterium]
MAAELRPNQEILTDTPPPPTPSRRGRSAPAPAEEADHDLLEACGITDLDQLARQCMTARQVLGKPTARWTARCLAVVIRLAVVTRGWPPALMEQALLAVARDQESRSPARVAEAGPWWDTVTLGVDKAMDAHELAEMEARLAETDGPRPALQAQARAELTAEGMPVIRSTVARRACASSTSTSCDERRTAHSTPIPLKGISGCVEPETPTARVRCCTPPRAHSCDGMGMPVIGCHLVPPRGVSALRI